MNDPAGWIHQDQNTIQAGVHGRIVFDRPSLELAAPACRPDRVRDEIHYHSKRLGFLPPPAVYLDDYTDWHVNWRGRPGEVPL